MARDGREAWARRVEEWKRSGLTAKQFADQRGIKPATLKWWTWKLGREAAPKQSKRTRAKARTLTRRPARRGKALSQRRARATDEALSPITFVEMSAPLRAAGFEPFEVLLPAGVRIRVPVDFDAVACCRPN
jgi:hypothetical protein